MAEWQHELELEEARQLSLALEASKRECAGLPSEDLIQVPFCLQNPNICTVIGSSSPGTGFSSCIGGIWHKCAGLLSEDLIQVSQGLRCPYVAC